jgi:hypothetical protein
MLKLAIYALLMKLSVAPSLPEEPEELQQRLMVIATAIETSVNRACCYEHDYTCTSIWGESRTKLAAMLLTKAYAETRLALNVHSGNCGRYQCGARVVRGKLVHLARTLWQHERPPKMAEGDWDAILGTSQSATSQAAWLATQRLVAGWHICHTREMGAFSRYATGGQCSWSGAEGRVRMSRAFEGTIATNLWQMSQ